MLTPIAEQHQNRGVEKYAPAVGWGLLFCFLLLNVPLFLRTPLWPDQWVQDLALIAISRGQVFYRDYFSSDLPGTTSIHFLVRALLGWRAEALRAFDLGVVVTEAATMYSLFFYRRFRFNFFPWLLITLLAFYFSTSEQCHCQRDTWMLLPVLVALAFRLRCIEMLRVSLSPSRVSSVVEGTLWGFAMWIKPHVAVPAIAAVLVSAVYAYKLRGKDGLMRVLWGGIPICVGGFLITTCFVAILVLSGAWPYFIDSIFVWFPDYRARESMLNHIHEFSTEFFPWNLIHLVAIPLALYGIAGAFKSDAIAPAKTMLAATYLAWIIQAVLLQHPFSYHLPPAIFLGIGVLFMNCGGFASPTRVSIAISSFGIAMSPAYSELRMHAWSECFLSPTSAQLEDTLALQGHADPYYEFNYANLRKAEAFLKSQNVGDGELTCWDWRLVRVYGDLNLLPSTRFILVNTDLQYFPHHRAEILASLKQSRQKFILTDLTASGIAAKNFTVERDATPGGLPPEFPVELRSSLPWSLPVVYRAGQYAVHKVTPPQSIETSPL